MIGALDHTHNPHLTSWVEGADDHQAFPIQNLPFGVFSDANDTAARGGVAIGDWVLDLAALASSGRLEGQAAAAAWAAAGPTLNDLLALPAGARAALRHQLSTLLHDPGHRDTMIRWLIPAEQVQLYVPTAIGDYTDFYVGIHHATNVGAIFRPDNPLLPNYKWVPIGYHGRASSVRASGHPVFRPNGQSKPPAEDAPRFGPSTRLDLELELGVWIGGRTTLGQPVPITEAANHVAGLCLLNDWSARDLQAWEYQPLGPFLSKNFLTTISPWIITTEALAPFRIAQPPRPPGDPQPLPYLLDADDQARGAYAIELEALLTTVETRRVGASATRIARGPASNMYWTFAQLVTHHTSGGCNLNPGDLFGSGTISAPSQEGFGSLLELTRGGAAPLTLANGEIRTFLQDGDEIILRAHAHAEGWRSIGFGECRGTVQAAPD